MPHFPLPQPGVSGLALPCAGEQSQGWFGNSSKKIEKKKAVVVNIGQITECAKSLHTAIFPKKL